MRMTMSLPDALTARSFGPAWALAVAAHALVAALLVFVPQSSRREEPLVRMVYLEPPPPPAAPLGMPDGRGVAALPAQPSAPQIEPDRRRDSAKPAVPDSARVRRIAARGNSKPMMKPEAQMQPPAPMIANVAPGVAAGSLAGQAGGVVGGVEGGLAGGVVGGTGAGPLPVEQVAQRPRLVHRVAPAYPEAARRRDIEGLVVLEAILDRDGRVESAVRVLKSIPMLDEEAIAAVRRWRFEPARDRGGDPVRVVLEIPIRFTLR